MAKANNNAETSTKGFIKDVEFDPKNPNAILDLNSFDYENLTGKSFEDYEEMLEELAPSLGYKKHSGSLFDFELHEVEPIWQERYPGIPNTPVDFKGVRLKINPAKNTSLVHRTRIYIRHARDLNSQIFNARGTLKPYARYYLLAQFKNEKP